VKKAGLAGRCLEPPEATFTFYSPSKNSTPMVNVQLKIVEEGLKHPIEELTGFITQQLFEDDILVKEGADLTLKVKFLTDVDQDLVLIQLRDSSTKQKLGEKVIHYLDHSWKEDISSEAHALLAGATVTH